MVGLRTPWQIIQDSRAPGSPAMFHAKLQGVTVRSVQQHLITCEGLGFDFRQVNQIVSVLRWWNFVQHCKTTQPNNLGRK